MVTSSRPDDPMDMLTPELLAATHRARRLRAAVAENPRSHAITTAELWKHAQRRPGEPVSFALERAIRADADLAARYRTLLQGFATAHAPMAIAASDGAIAARRVGAYSFERVDDDGAPMLIIRIAEGAAAPEMIELIRGERTLRFAPGEPVAGAIMLALDTGADDGKLLAELLADPATEIYVF
jgi:hypothetical protein